MQRYLAVVHKVVRRGSLHETLHAVVEPTNPDTNARHVHQPPRLCRPPHTTVTTNITTVTAVVLMWVVVAVVVVLLRAVVNLLLLHPKMVPSPTAESVHVGWLGLHDGRK